MTGTAGSMGAVGAVGIVVVSHSRALADAAVELARQMLHGPQVRIAVASGLDDGTLGTDALRIQAAIAEVDSPQGTLVLMDLGSAVLSAELALDLLEPDVRERVMLCPAPLVEGLVVAVVAAAGGAPLAGVAAEAEGALSAKQSHLAPQTVAAPALLEGPPPPEGSPPEGPELSRQGPVPSAEGVFVVRNAHGLHVRPAARLVGEVLGFDAEVTLTNLTTGSPAVPAASMSRVATLGVLRGHEVRVAASGRQAREAVEHVLALAARGFGEAPDEARVETPCSAEDEARLMPGDGLPRGGSPGIGIGPLWTPRVVPIEVTDVPQGGPDAEWRRLFDALEAVRGELRGHAHGIFDAHLMLLDDAELLGQARQAIDEGHAAQAAWAQTMRALEGRMAGLADPYQRARAADVRAVADQVLRALLGGTARLESRDGVLVAADLTPAEVSELDPKRVKGIMLAHGNPTAHSAILARGRGLPMVVGAGPGVLELPEGTTICLDGTTGEWHADPDPGTLARYSKRAEAQRQAHAAALATAAQPARTLDGRVITVSANVGSPEEARQAVSAGAEAAGLVRTEFLFLGRAQPPSIAEQEAAYRAIAEALGGRRMTLRTLDAGGDKPLPYLRTGGLRGIRLTLAHPDLLRDQLIAVCRVARDHPVGLMFPMVYTVDELTTALGMLGPRPPGLEVGIMVEVPAAALKAKAFVPHVDFFSIGTNDLAQITLATERGHADAHDPAVLRLIGEVCRAAKGAAKGHARVAVCGEFAADEKATAPLVGLGVDELSVAPLAVPHIKQAVRRVRARAA